MKHYLHYFMLFLCTLVAGSAHAEVDPAWAGKVVQRLETATQTLSDGWYMLYNVNRGSCVLDNGSAYKMAEMPAALTPFSADDRGGMLFHIAPASDGNWNITSALGHNVALGNNNSSQPADAHTFTIEHIGSNADLFYMVDAQTGYVADGQERGNAFVGWTQSAPTATTGNHAVYQFYAVEEVPAVMVTYHITATDAQGANPVTWDLTKAERPNTFAGATLDEDYVYVSNFVCTSSDAFISATNKEFSFTATYTLPMESGKKYQVRQTGGNNRYMAAIDDNDTNVTLRASKSVSDANTVWSVVHQEGTFDVYLVNEARQQSIKALRDGKDNMAYYALGDQQAQAYEFVAGADGFKLFEPGTGRNLGNHGHLTGGNTSLGVWGSGRESGTTFVAEEVVPYTITVTGHADGRIVYGEAEYTTGTTLYIPAGETFEAVAVAKQVEGYVGSVKVEGNSVKVNYISNDAVEYTVVYKYVDALDNSTVLKTVTSKCRMGTDLPAVESFAGKQVLNAPEGTVEGNATYTILVFDLSGEDQVDPEKPATVRLTYRLVGPDGAEWGSEVFEAAANGQAYPKLSRAIPAGVSVALPTGVLSTMQTELTVDVPCTSTFALTFADSYNNIKQWYGVTITNNKTPFHYEQGATYMPLSGKASNDENYLFALVGNPFTGFKLYNKAAGSGMILSSPNPATTTGSNGQVGTGQYCWPVMKNESALPAGNNTYWDFTANGAGYYISRHGESGFHLNSRADSGNGSVLAYWNSTDDGSRIYFAPEGVQVLNSYPATATPTSGKIYRIYSVRSAGKMIMEDANHNLMKTDAKKNKDFSQLWVLETSATNSSAFTLRNAETGRFIVAPSGNNAQAVTQTAAAPLYFVQKPARSDSNNKPYYGIGGNPTDTGNNWLNTNNNTMKIIGYSFGTDVGSGWVIEEATDVTLAEVKARVKAHSPYASLTSGKYYRLVNKNYPERRMVESYVDNHNVRGLEDGVLPNDDAQIWKITADGSNGYTLQNAFTHRYIKDMGSLNTAFPTTDQLSSAKRFQTITSGGDDWSAPQYAFVRANSGHNSLHCDAGKNVVLWTHNADASLWSLEPVELSLEQAAAVHQEYLDFVAEQDALNQIAANAENFNAALGKVFADAACTEMFEGYKSLSDFRLRAVLAALGLNEEIQNMAVRVKNNTWEPERDATYNKYVRDFRIADYEPYSDRHVWSGITRVGAFGQLVNPTGITVKMGDVLYVYVGDEVKDNEAELKLEVAEGTANTGTQSQPLHKGLNVYSAPKTGEIFVFYNVTNRDKYVEGAYDLDGVWHDPDYPNIRVHIEGGQASGMWDAHRDMKDSDWDYLCENMFTAPYLHVKGHNTVVNAYTEKVRGAERVTDIMKILDYIFMTEEKLIGHDGQWNGRYKPVMTVRDQVSGAPNWSGTSINLSGITKEGDFNYENLMRERWVYYHEEAHGHQYPINLVATTESSNNGLAQMVNHEFGLSSRRKDGTKTLMTFKNNGWGWVDILRGGEGISRENGFEYYDAALWLQNHLFYQLYLYFHAAGYMPDFWPRLCDEMRKNGGLIQHGGNPNPPTYYYDDYFKFAEACAKVSKTDLTEFFDCYGFFGYYDDVKVGNDFTNSKGQGFRDRDDAAAGIRYVGDYGSYYLKMPVKTNAEDVQRIENLKAFMKAQPNKAPGIMFIDDHILPRTVTPDCFAVKIDPSREGQPVAFYSETGKQGDFGDFAQFSADNVASGIKLTADGITGEGLVGVKVYDDKGNLKYIYNTNSFTLPAEAKRAVAAGTYTIAVVLGDGTQLPLNSKDFDMNLDGTITIDDVALLVKAARVTTDTYNAGDVSKAADNALKAK